MIRTVVKIIGFHHGGKAVVKFPSNFRRMKPEHRISFLDQSAKQIRDERDLAARHLAIERRDEDLRAAESIQPQGRFTG